MTDASGYHTTPSERAVSKPRGRWFLAMLAGMGAGAPVSVLLSYAGLLPFYLGPFFFLLFGLIIGAAMFRVAKVLRPWSGLRIVGCAAVVISHVFVASLVLESWQLGPHAGLMVAKKTRQLPPGLDAGEFRSDVGRRLQEYITENHPPGGLIGYVRWAATDGTYTVEVPDAKPAQVTYVFSQSNVGWTLRVLVSLVLLAGGILSQVLPLRRPERGPTSDAATSPAGEPDVHATPNATGKAELPTLSR